MHTSVHTCDFRPRLVTIPTAKNVSTKPSVTQRPPWKHFLKRGHAMQCACTTCTLTYTYVRKCVRTRTCTHDHARVCLRASMRLYAHMPTSDALAHKHVRTQAPSGACYACMHTHSSLHTHVPVYFLPARRRTSVFTHTCDMFAHPSVSYAHTITYAQYAHETATHRLRRYVSMPSHAHAHSCAKTQKCAKSFAFPGLLFRARCPQVGWRALHPASARRWRRPTRKRVPGPGSVGQIMSHKSIASLS